MNFSNLIRLPVLFVLLSASGMAAAEKLNLLIITADDMNADSPSWMGNTVVRTPNIDAFAATGHRFLNNHVSAPICQPSRSAIMTGRVPHRSGALGFNPINDDVPNLAEVLKAQGYFVAILNKAMHTAVKTNVESPWDFLTKDSGKDPAKLVAQMTQALRLAAEAKKPFFINCNSVDPHRPFYGATPGPGAGKQSGKKQKAGGDGEGAGEGQDARVVQPFAPGEVKVPSFLEDVPPVREEVAQYYGNIRRLDLAFGLIMKALKDSGEEARTVVLFMSDHGMSFPFSKATVYRNGTWSPVVLRWPEMGTAQVRQEMTSSVDIMPTLLEVLGAKAPAGMDGRSWLPLLRGDQQPDRDFVVTHVNGVSSGLLFPQRCVRTATRSLIFEAWSDGQRSFKVESMAGLSYNGLAEAAKSDARIKARVDQYIRGAPLQFFDLEKDPDERVNLIDDLAYRGEIELMKRRLLAHMRQTNDPQLENFSKVAGLPK